MSSCKTILFITTAFVLTSLSLNAQQTERVYLSGTDKDHRVDWEFFCTDGMNSGKWTTIPVPSQWETEGFGVQNYGHDKNPSREKGFYRYTFHADDAWRGRKIFIVFEGSMTDTEVKINGLSAGPVHQGGFYQFRYDITDLLKLGGSNFLEVNVSKESENPSINGAERRADFWIFGGIYRPVYLEIKPEDFIERVAIDAKHDGSFYMETYVHASPGMTPEAQVETLDGRPVGPRMAGVKQAEDGKYLITGKFKHPATWTSETPNLYKVVVRLKSGKKIIHEYEQTFGFRTVEFRPSDGFYINGVKVRFKGVNRHTFWPETGRTTSKDVAILDVNLIKDMNMNAVRMSHYPPDSYFLDVCDSLGLYVIDELAGWHSAYDPPTAHRLVKQMVDRDVNHPCIFIWSNGNEGGFPKEARGDYAMHDPQKRRIVEPISEYDGLDTRHYPKYDYTLSALTAPLHTSVFMPTEFLHGLHDGGLGAGLDDYWNLMLKSPLAAGGFLWALLDEGVVRRDMRDSLDVAGNYAPDGIVGPHREKEGSFYTIKEIWSPVYLGNPEFDGSFDGKLKVENRYHFTNLKQCSFSWKLVSLERPLGKEDLTLEKTVPSPDIAPGNRSSLALGLPGNWRDYDVLYFTATDPTGREIHTWSWNISSRKQFAIAFQSSKKDPVAVRENDSFLRVTCGDTEVTFNKGSGLIESVCYRLKNLSLKDGPRFTGIEDRFKELRYYPDGDAYVVEAVYENNGIQRWTIQGNGWLKLDYSYILNGKYDYAGITFSYPENKVLGANLLANGPYHVWQNRLKGVTFGYHVKKYNNTLTGNTWNYPEFKGYYSNFYAVELITKELPFTVVSGTDGIYLHLFTPGRPSHAVQRMEPMFPDNGNLSFLSVISPVGTKFTYSYDEGPQGEQKVFEGETIRGELFFKFGK